MANNNTPTGADAASAAALQGLTGAVLAVGADQSHPDQPPSQLVAQTTQNPQSGTQQNSTPNGPDYLFSQYPNEFEYYACGFELVDSSNQVIAFFTFPVMPESIQNSYKPQSNIVKTMAGISISNNPTFAPFDIAIAGNFGRKFRRVRTDLNGLVGSNATQSSSSTKAPQTVTNPLDNVTAAGTTGTTLAPATVTPAQKIFNSDYKTGYACCKILEGILIKANRSDVAYGAYRLFFHNFSFNQSFLVEITSFDFGMGMESNRIWRYTVNMKAIGPASSFDPNKKAAVSRLLDSTSIIGTQGQLGNQATSVLNQKPYNKLTGTNSSPLQTLMANDIGSRAVQTVIAYQPNVVRAALELAENPQDISYFLYNQGSSSLNTGKIF